MHEANEAEADVKALNVAIRGYHPYELEQYVSMLKYHNSCNLSRPQNIVAPSKIGHFCQVFCLFNIAVLKCFKS